MANTRKLKIEILGDPKDASRAFQTIGQDAGKMEGKLKKVGKGAALAVGGIAAGAVGAAAVLAPKILSMGGELESLRVKSEAVFEDSLGGVRNWAKENARSMGLTNDEATGLAASMGDLLKPMGFTSDQAADMSTEMLGLSGALSAWSGGQKSAAEVSEILSKAMLGERDQLKSLGIAISEADVQARLAKNGQDELTGAALQQAKAIATQQLIMEKSTDAQKAWADGSQDGAKAQMEAEAAIKNVKEGLVKALYPAILAVLPVVEKLAVWFGEKLPPAMEAIAAWTRENWPKIRDTIQTTIATIRGHVDSFVKFATSVWAKWGDDIMAVVNVVWPAMRAIVESTIKVVRGVIQTVTGLIKGDWSGVWNGIKTTLSGVWDGIVALVKLQLGLLKLALSGAWTLIQAAVKLAWDKFTETIRTAMTTAKDWVKSGVDGIVGFVKAIPDRVTSAVSGGFDGIKSAFKSAVNWIIDKWNGLSFSLPSMSIPGFGSFGGQTISTPNIPRIHSGGNVGGRSFAGLANDEVAAILQRGETVLTRGQRAAISGTKTEIKIWVGDRELTDIIKVTVDGELSEVESMVMAGQR